MVVAPNGGRQLQPLPTETVVLKLTGADTNGLYALFESIDEPQSGPPPHVHRLEDETFFVIEGIWDFHIGDEGFVVEAGAVVHAPRDVPHFYVNRGPSPARLLVLAQPAGIEEMFEALHALGEAGPPEIADVLATVQRFGVEPVAPPPV